MIKHVELYIFVNKKIRRNKENCKSKWLAEWEDPGQRGSKSKKKAKFELEGQPKSKMAENLPNYSQSYSETFIKDLTLKF